MNARASIRYCTKCRWLTRASWMAQELLTTFESELEELALIPGDVGEFEVRVGGEVVWSRAAEGRFPELKELKQRIRDRVAPERHLGHSDHSDRVGVMPRGESLHHKYPDYRVDLEPGTERVCARLDGVVVADSVKVIVVKEAELDPVVYFPRADVAMELLERTDHETFCPFKGQASYWTLRSNGREEVNAVWSYEDPFPEVAGIKDHLAFYPDRVEWSGGQGAPPWRGG